MIIDSLNKVKQTVKVCMFFVIASVLFISCGEMSLDVRTQFENEETLFIDIKLMATGSLAEQLNSAGECKSSIVTSCSHQLDVSSNSRMIWNLVPLRTCLLVASGWESSPIR